jgi:tripartite-type tricarboxylate transporter receptor subunit TctC
LFADQLELIIPQFVPSGGGYSAAVSAMKKEVDFAACGFAEAIELIKGGELRALAYWGEKPVTLPNGTVVTTFGTAFPKLKTFEPFGGWVGMAVPRGVPADVLATLVNAYDTAIHQQSFINFCNQSNFLFMGKVGADADAFAKQSTSVNAYLMYDLGFTKTNPATLGIQRLK